MDGTCDWRNFENCTDKELVKRPLKLIFWKTYWDKHGHKIYVKEAERRGLSCGVEQLDNATYSCEPLNPEPCEDEELVK